MDNEQSESISPENEAEINKTEEEFTGFHLYRNKSDDEEPISTLWLLTFTDVMALMLTFFVLLYSMAQPDIEKWSEMTAAINSNFSKRYAPKFEAGSIDAINIDRINRPSALDLRYLASIVQQALDRSENTEGILLIAQSDALVISMPNDLFFEAGRAEIGTDGQRALIEIGGALAKIRNAIEIVGHADPRPLSAASEYGSNWQLSLDRALSVAGVLENVGYNKPVTVRGMSSTRFMDLPDDLPESERLNLSRRVDIVILKNAAGARSFFGMKL
jgi:chemotaxis protein MotB